MNNINKIDILQLNFLILLTVGVLVCLHDHNKMGNLCPAQQYHYQELVQIADVPPNAAAEEDANIIDDIKRYHSAKRPQAGTLYVTIEGKKVILPPQFSNPDDEGYYYRIPLMDYMLVAPYGIMADDYPELRAITSAAKPTFVEFAKCQCTVGDHSNSPKCIWTFKTCDRCAQTKMVPVSETDLQTWGLGRCHNYGFCGLGSIMCHCQAIQRHIHIVAAKPMA